MDRDRYIENPYEDDSSNLFQNDKLRPTFCNGFIDQIKTMIGDLLENFTFDPNNTSVYTGGAGAALLFLKIFETNLGEQVCPEENVLQKAQALTDICLPCLKKHRYTFLCGCIGPLTIKAIANFYQGHDYDIYLTEIANIVENSLQDDNISDEILYGRAGVLYALLLIRSKIGQSKEIIRDQLIQQLVDAILNSGEITAKREESSIPLVYYWHEKEYIGAAHGYAGILYMLLEARQYLTDDDLNALVKPTIDFVLELQFDSGNFPSSVKVNKPDDKLLHWCHGAPGVIHLLILAYQVFNDEDYLDAAVKCADDIWKRGLLKKGFGICHGVSGNGYAQLRMYQLTNDQKYLHRAVRFGQWCYTRGKSHVTRIPDRPLSMFEGLAGTAHYLIDLLSPQDAKFPAFQL